MMRRYITIVGIILAVVVGLAIWQKPPLENMRKSVETALADYQQQHGIVAGSPGGKAESHDWIVAASHSVKLESGETFSCFGAYRITVCQSPD